MKSFETRIVGTRAQVPLVETGDGTVMLTNTDQNNTIYLSDDYGAQPGGANTIALPPGATIVFNGEGPVFAVTAIGASATALVVPGGVNFFQFVKILAKIIEISATAGNGLFVYSGSPAVGNLVASLTSVAAGFDPVGNATVGPGLAFYANLGGVLPFYAMNINAAGITWRNSPSVTTPYGGLLPPSFNFAPSFGFTFTALAHRFITNNGTIQFKQLDIGNQLVFSGNGAGAATPALVDFSSSDLAVASMSYLVAGSVSNSNAETVIGTFTIPANDGQFNSGYRFRAFGKISTVGVAPTIDIRLRLDTVAGTLLGDTSPLTALINLTGIPWFLDGFLYLDASGAAGSISSAATLAERYTAATVLGQMAAEHGMGRAQQAIDTTISHTVLITAQFNNAAVGNSALTYIGSMERIVH